MPRAKSETPVTEIKVSLPSELVAAIDIIIWDPVLQKPRYGMRAKLFALLATRWLETKRQPEGGYVTLDEDEILAADDIQLAAEQSPL